MSVILLRRVAISTERSTDQPCAFDMCDTARSYFMHRSSSCVFQRWSFPNLGFIDLLSCIPLPATLHSLASQNLGLV